QGRTGAPLASAPYRLAVQALDGSADGRWLATQSEWGKGPELVVWEVQRRGRQFTLEPRWREARAGGNACSLVFSPDARVVLTQLGVGDVGLPAEQTVCNVADRQVRCQFRDAPGSVAFA